MVVTDGLGVGLVLIAPLDPEFVKSILPFCSRAANVNPPFHHALISPDALRNLNNLTIDRVTQ